MPELTINDLSERTGVPRRTIRYYVEIGLLARPSGAGRAATYGREHLDQLRAIRRLQAQGLSLDQVRDAMAPGAALVPPSGAVMAPTIDMFSVAPEAVPAERDHSAAEYLASVRRRIGAPPPPEPEAPQRHRKPSSTSDAWQAEPWLRVVLDRDVELHVRRMTAKRTALLVKALRRVLDEESERTT